MSGDRFTEGLLEAVDRHEANEAKRPRPSWDEYFLAMATVVARRATCDRKHVGAIIVDERHRIVSTGYNGSARGLPHCDDVGHLMKEIEGRQSCVRTLHAESNALDDAGRRSEAGTIYVTVIPCFNCAKRIVNAGIRRVLWSEFYKSQNTDLVLAFLMQAGVQYKGPQD
jgi:dCMP deaminase